MSNTIDNRVVQMEFENKNFESNANTSISTLDKLKQALKLDGAGGALNNAEKALGKLDLSSLSSGIDAVKDRFSLLGIIGMTAIWVGMTGNATAAAAKVEGMVKYGNNASNGLMVSTSDGGTWVKAEDDSPNQYVEFTVTCPEGKKLDISSINMKIGGKGGGVSHCQRQGRDAFGDTSPEREKQGEQKLGDYLQRRVSFRPGGGSSRLYRLFRAETSGGRRRLPICLFQYRL